MLGFWDAGIIKAMLGFWDAGIRHNAGMLGLPEKCWDAGINKRWCWGAWLEKGGEGMCSLCARCSRESGATDG
jgi:hypothetical protein